MMHGHTNFKFKLRSSVLWRAPVWLVFTDVSEEPAASICVEEAKCSSTRYVRNVSNCGSFIDSLRYVLHPPEGEGWGQFVTSKRRWKPIVLPRFSAAQFACPGDVGGVSAKDCGGQNGRKLRKPLSDEEFVDQMKQAKLQWLQDRSPVNADNPNNVRHEAGRHLRNRRGNIWKVQLMSFKHAVRTGISDIQGVPGGMCQISGWCSLC
jgi:hypothetical protein